MDMGLENALEICQTHVRKLVADSSSRESSAQELIVDALAIRAASDHVLHAAVQRARDRGASWQLIGDALGISRQGAFQRYRDPGAC